MTEQQFEKIKAVYEEARNLQEGIEILEHIQKSTNDKDIEMWVEILSKDKVTDRVRPLVDTFRHILDTDAIYEIIKEELDGKIEAMLPSLLKDMIEDKKRRFEALNASL